MTRIFVREKCPFAVSISCLHVKFRCYWTQCLLNCHSWFSWVTTVKPCQQLQFQKWRLIGNKFTINKFTMAMFTITCFESHWPKRIGFMSRTSLVPINFKPELYSSTYTQVCAFFAKHLCEAYLRCIKDWISTVLYWQRLHIISQERKMLWVYGEISNHIPPGHAHTFLIRSYPQSVLTELLICRSNCSHFSSWIQVSLLSTGFSVGGWSSAREFPRNGENRLQKYHVRKRFLFFYSVLLHCQSSDRPFIAACAVVRSSV